MSLLLAGCGTSGFGWGDYPNIEARYNFTDLATMHTSMAVEFDGATYLEIDEASVTAYQ